jgi:galactoside O-acetyltransferase
VQIDEGVFIFAGQGVVIGHCVHLAVGSSISGGGECVIGDFAGIGAGVRLLTGTEEIDRGGLTNPTVPPELRTVRRGRVEIGAHALVLTNSVVLPDITIGEGAVVGAGSVVHHDLKPWGIYAGTPLVQVGVREAEPVLKKAQEALGIADLR